MKAICNKFPKTMLFIGPSGSGKDTQAKLLTDMCGYVRIATGDMFRDPEVQSTEKGKQAQEYAKRGDWVPDELVYDMLSDWLKQFDSSSPWIFSGVVRTPEQIPMLDSVLKNEGRVLDKVVYFDLSDEAAIERMSFRRICPKCGADYHLKYKKPANGEMCDVEGEALIQREDDYPEAIVKRLKNFEETIEPILNRYKELGILLEVDASPSIDNIHKDLLEKLSNEG